ncbi:MAG: rod shape-determining protein, partial [Acidobacteria bacterium]|nr:rod shape-determining protein [Acidobacteriota bacterium]
MNSTTSNSGILKVGIDLGTSRSSISAANGQRHMVQSYVGWPRDMVARKVLGRDVLVGAEALEHRPMLDLRRPLERGLIKEGSTRDEKAVRELVRRLLELAAPAASGPAPTVHAVIGVPAETLRVNRQHLRRILTGQVASTMVVSEPFAVAYGLDALVHTMVIDVGAGTTDFCVLMGRFPTE